MRRKGSDRLCFRHRRPPRHPGNDHALCNTRQRVFCIQRCCRTTEARNARRHIVSNLLLFQAVDLLSNRPVQARVARMQPHCHLLSAFRLFHDGNHFFQRHLRAVVNSAVFFCKPEQCRIDQTARINNNIRFFQKSAPPQCDQIRCAAACPNKMNHFFTPLQSQL